MSSMRTSGGTWLAGLPAVRPLAPLAAIQPKTVGRAHDAAILFKRIREVAGLDLIETAQRLHTFPSVIDALEQGDFEHLPPWPDTVVVVSGFTALAGIDPRPVLIAIRERIESKIIEANAAEVPSPRVRATPQQNLFEPRTPGKDRPGQSERKRHVAAAKVPQSAASTPSVMKTVGTALADRQRSTLKLAAQSSAALSRSLQSLPTRAGAFKALARLSPLWRKPVALSLAVSLPLVAFVSFGSSGPLQAAVASLPQPVAGVVRSLEDYVLRTLATQRNGLTWIEVNDPRSRKTDKLPNPRR